jgi:hypothetical protein
VVIVSEFFECAMLEKQQPAGILAPAHFAVKQILGETCRVLYGDAVSPACARGDM